MARVFAALSHSEFPEGVAAGTELHITADEWGPMYRATRADEQNPPNGIAREALTALECLWDSDRGEVWNRQPVVLMSSTKEGNAVSMFETYAAAAKEAISQIEERRGTPSHIGSPVKPVWKSAGFTHQSMQKLHRMAGGEFDKS